MHKQAAEAPQALPKRASLTNPFHFVATGFGSGLLKPAPGTWGSLVAIPLLLVLHQYTWLTYALVTFIAAVGGIWLCGKVADDLGVDDHPSIVWDEIVGMAIALAYMPSGYATETALFGFLSFRFFDIKKPSIIGWCDRNLKAGLGIMVDDIIAGFAALACTFMILQFLPSFSQTV